MLSFFTKTNLRYSVRPKVIFSQYDNAKIFKRWFQAHSASNLNNTVIIQEKEKLLNIAQQVVDLVKLYPDRMLQFESHEIYQSLTQNNAIGIIEEKNNLVGFIQVKLWPTFINENKPIIEICTGVVKSTHQGKGFGDFLFSKILGLAKDKYKDHQIFAVVEKGNKVAQKIAAKYGQQVTPPSILPCMKGTESIYELQPAFKLTAHIENRCLR